MYDKCFRLIISCKSVYKETYDSWLVTRSPYFTFNAVMWMVVLTLYVSEDSYILYTVSYLHRYPGKQLIETGIYLFFFIEGSSSHKVVSETLSYWSLRLQLYSNWKLFVFFILLMEDCTPNTWLLRDETNEISVLFSLRKIINPNKWDD